MRITEICTISKFAAISIDWTHNGEVGKLYETIYWTMTGPLKDDAVYNTIEKRGFKITRWRPDYYLKLDSVGISALEFRLKILEDLYP